MYSSILSVHTCVSISNYQDYFRPQTDNNYVNLHSLEYIPFPGPPTENDPPPPISICIKIETYNFPKS